MSSSRPERTPFDACLDEIDVIFRIARRVTGSAVHAADLVQETYLEAWRSFSRSGPPIVPRAWLCRILFRVWRRQRGGHAAVVFEETLTSANEPGSAAADPWRTTELIRAFERLSVEHRAVVMLTDVEGLSYREAAEALGIPIGTVMSRLNRARRHLRQMLTPTERPHLRLLRAGGKGRT